MSDPNQDRDEVDHWSRLAEEFGLPPDSESAPALPARAPEPMPPPRALVDQPSAPIGREPRADGEPPARGRRRRSSAQEPEPVRAEAAEEVPVAEADGNAAPVAEEGGPDGEKRRPSRRRRGRRSGKGATAGEVSERVEGAPVEAEDASPDEKAGPGDEPSDEESDGDRSRRKRGRGRGRKKPVVVEKSEPVEDAADEDLEQPEPQDEETDEEMTNFSNWSVPSWQELIASLYRPER